MQNSIGAGHIVASDRFLDLIYTNLNAILIRFQIRKTIHEI
jgi:hypothetical protein